MTQRFAWVLNLDAELELLRGSRGYVAPRKLTAQLASHGQSARRLLGPRDVLIEADGTITRAPVAPGAPGAPVAPGAPGAEPAGLVGRAWCPTPRALEAMRRASVEPEAHPSPELLRRVNHRLFAHQLGGGLPDQTYVRDRSELAGVLGQPERRWLLKRPLTFAGRGQLRTLGPITQKQEEWIAASLSHDGILVEPLVQPLVELSLHGFVWPDGRHELGRICLQQVSARGHFQAVRLAQAGDLLAGEANAFEERGEAAARALHAAGYFGPFGIDGYRYELAGRVGFCALSELNARYTLGFVTGFPRPPDHIEPLLPPNDGALPTTPLEPKRF
jgi:hypothetical protein